MSERPLEEPGKIVERDEDRDAGHSSEENDRHGAAGPAGIGRWDSPDGRAWPP